MEYRNDTQYFIKGSSIIKIDANNFPDNVSSGLIYEVFKIKNGKALFLDEHLQRLNKSLEIKSLPKIIIKEYAALVDVLLEKNNRVEGNVKIVVTFDDANLDIPLLYYIPHQYPTINQYEKGIKVVLQNAERRAPQAKVYNLKIRGKANEIISYSDIYETLLVNEANQITEGSRSNVFFIKDNQLITAPDDLVLLGVTRAKVLEIAEMKGIEIIYRAIKSNEIKSIDAAFISGTSPDIIKITQIDEFKMSGSNKIFQLLYSEYNKLI